MPTTKAKKTPQARTKNAGTARSRRRARRAGAGALPPPLIDAATQRYLECAAGGQPAGTGVPDGDGRLSIVKNFKHYITFLPDSTGNITFYLTMTPTGHVTITRGVCGNVENRSYFNTANGKLVSSSVSKTDSPDSVVHYGPKFMGMTPYSVLSSPNAPTPAGWRVVNARWHLMYTGPKLSAAGHCTITPYTASDKQGVSPVASDTTGFPVPWYISSDAGAAVNPSTITKPAVRDTVITMIPRNSSYQDVDEIVAGFPTGASVGITSGPPVAGGIDVGLRPHQACRVYAVRYAGLAPDASITIDHASCIQYLVDPDGTEAPLARPSAVGNQSVLNQFLASISAHPAVGDTLAEVKKGIFNAAGLALAGAGRYAVRALPALLP